MDPSSWIAAQHTAVIYDFWKTYQIEIRPISLENKVSTLGPTFYDLSIS